MKSPGNSGYSLIEVLVALLIVGILIVTTITVFSEMRKNIVTYGVITTQLAQAQNTMEASRTSLFTSGDPKYVSSCAVLLVDKDGNELASLSGKTLYIPYYTNRGLLVFARSGL